ncbi:MAG: biotin/lipoyl-binding protein [Pirellulaceae bacterium]
MNHVEVSPGARESGAASTSEGEHMARTRPSPATRPKREGGTLQSSARKKRRRKNRNRLLSLLLVASAATVAGGWWWYADRAASETESGPVTATVARRDFSSSVLATGAVQAQVGAEVRVGARISGKVERLLANIGDPVTKGQVLARLEKADLEATVAQREAELQLAEAKLAAVQNLLPKEIQQAELEMSRYQATRTLCEQEMARESRLLESAATSKQAFEEAEERLAVVQAQLNSAEQAYELAKARYEEDRKQALAEVARARSALDNANVHSLTPRSRLLSTASSPWCPPKKAKRWRPACKRPPL